MVTVGETQVWHDMHSLSRDVNRIANVVEAWWAREREAAGHVLKPKRCSSEGCPGEVIVEVNGRPWCQQHLDQGFAMLNSIKAWAERPKG